MKDKSTEIGKTYRPKKHSESDNEIVGDYWRVWIENDRCFYEYDAGHFASKFVVFEITKEDFVLIKSGKITNQDLTKKYTC